MKPKRVTLVIVDISGYTQFIRLHKMSAIHAEEIIFDLLETVMDRADYPLTLNKLEGDAAFRYAEMDGDNDAEVACDVARQARGFFKAFYARAQSLSRERANCDCDACRRILDLKLKAVLHLGEAFFKTIRQFEELAGEDVILVHQLLKNSIPSDEYIFRPSLPEAATFSPAQVADVLHKHLLLNDFDHPFYWAAFTYTDW